MSLQGNNTRLYGLENAINVSPYTVIYTLQTQIGLTTTPVRVLFGSSNNYKVVLGESSALKSPRSVITWGITPANKDWIGYYTTTQIPSGIHTINFNISPNQTGTIFVSNSSQQLITLDGGQFTSTNSPLSFSYIQFNETDLIRDLFLVEENLNNHLIYPTVTVSQFIQSVFLNTFFTEVEYYNT